MHIKDIEQFGKRESAVYECFKRLPLSIKNDIKKNIDFLILRSTSYVKYNIKQEELSRVLIVINDVHDLSNNAMIGLTAHLFALYSMGYDKKPVPKGKPWLTLDLLSDEIAKSWGFEDEVDELRTTRPQKLPEEVGYPDIVIDYSVPNTRFNTDTRSALSKHSDVSSSQERLWYVDRFSMICSLEKLRREDVEFLHIFTDKYKKESIEKIYSNPHA